MHHSPVSVRRIILCLTVFSVLLTAFPARALTRDELRSLFQTPAVSEADALFDAEPLLTAPYEAGRLGEETALSALANLNVLRRLAGLNSVSLSGELSDISQHGAVLMAVLGGVTHTPSQPDDLPDDFFSVARFAAGNCNLARFNWFSPSVLNESLIRFLQDDADANPAVLGHRRWLLNPRMKSTGFGLAVDVLGQSYVSVYATDESEACPYDFVAWPCPGAFPAEFMTMTTPWSISPNPAVYDLDKSNPHIIITELTSGAVWNFDEAGVNPAEQTYFIISGERCGDGPAYIFRPDPRDNGLLENGYEQNQHWHVSLTGMILTDGSKAAPIEYDCEMASLTPIDPASVELSVRSLSLTVGESVSVTAQVYPRWADDLFFTLSTDDETVAVVDETGLVSALGAGQCRLIAQTVNGRADEIEITIKKEK